MRAELRDREIELIAESDNDRDALARLHRGRTVKVLPGRSSDPSYPPDPRQTNVVLQFPDPNDWGT